MELLRPYVNPAAGAVHEGIVIAVQERVAREFPWLALLASNR
jgi:hypothetical protein